MYPDVNSSFHFLDYIKEQDDLYAIAGMKRLLEFWAQMQGLLSSDELAGWGFFYLKATFTYCIGMLWGLIHLHAMWNMKCARKQISTKEVGVLLPSCAWETTWWCLLTLRSWLCHCSENTSGQKEGVSGTASSFWSTVGNGLWPSARGHLCRLLACSYGRWGVESCIKFSFPPGLLCQKCF